MLTSDEILDRVRAMTVMQRELMLWRMIVAVQGWDFDQARGLLKLYEFDQPSPPLPPT